MYLFTILPTVMLQTSKCDFLIVYLLSTAIFLYMMQFPAWATTTCFITKRHVSHLGPFCLRCRNSGNYSKCNVV